MQISQLTEKTKKAALEIAALINTYTNSAAERIQSPKGFWTAFALLSLIFTVAGYLICVAITAIIF